MATVTSLLPSSSSLTCMRAEPAIPEDEVTA